MTSRLRPTLLPPPDSVDKLPVCPSPRISSGYARLLVSSPDAQGLAEELPLLRMRDHLARLCALGSPHRQAYEAVLPQLEFAANIHVKQMEALQVCSMSTLIPPLAPLPLSSWILRHVGRRIETSLRERNSTLVAAYAPTHAMLMQFVKEAVLPGADQTYAIRLYNTGDGIEDFHVYRGGNKYQTQFEVRGARLMAGDAGLNTAEFVRMMRIGAYLPRGPRGLGRDVESVYAWASSKGGVHRTEQGTVQARQSTGNCTHKAVLAFLRHNLSDVAYTEAVATLLEAAAVSYAARGSASKSAEVLEAALLNKARRARAKADSAVWRERHVAEAGDVPWLVHSTDRTAMVRALNASQAKHGKAYLVTYRKDERRVVLTTCEVADQFVRQPVVVGPDGGLSLEGREGRYASLKQIASEAESRGYAAVTSQMFGRYVD